MKRRIIQHQSNNYFSMNQTQYRGFSLFKILSISIMGQYRFYHLIILLKYLNGLYLEL